MRALGALSPARARAIEQEGALHSGLVARVYRLSVHSHPIILGAQTRGVRSWRGCSSLREWAVNACVRVRAVRCAHAIERRRDPMLAPRGHASSPSVHAPAELVPVR